MKTIQKIFIANRGEIAQRITVTAKRMGLDVVVPVSEADAKLDYLNLATETVVVSTNLKDSFLNADKMIELALQCGADAIHPGYGFLSENSEFARLCSEAGLIWIGPSFDLIKKMGNKQEAIETAALLNIPTLNGRFGKPAELMKMVRSSDLPIIVKASNGGGGKGIHVVDNLSELEPVFEKAAREANNLFGSEDVFVEKYIPKARHIEVQVMGDKHGNVIHLFSRECSVQRRFQKLIEEAPAPGLSDTLQKNLLDAALKICHYISYENAGTVEFIVDGEDFYFLEMNTRIQVEHPVTEEVTGIDLIELQIQVAAGDVLPYAQDDIKINGHAIESRIYAEDPQKFFAPSPGEILHLSYPEGEGLRVETAIRKEQNLSVSYDPLIAKIISAGKDRNEAINMHLKALSETHVAGIATSTDFLALVISDPRFTSEGFYTKLLDEEMPSFLNRLQSNSDKKANVFSGVFQFLLQTAISKINADDVWSTIGFWRPMTSATSYINDKPFYINVLDIQANSIRYVLESGDEIFVEDIRREGNMLYCNSKDEGFVYFITEGLSKKGIKAYEGSLELQARSYKSRKDKSVLDTISNIKGCVEVKASLPGKVIKLNVQQGEKVKRGEQLLVFESMKIENSITASNDGFISDLNICEGQQLSQNEILLIIKDNQ